MDWAVVATAPDQMTAEMWSDLVRSSGIACRLHPGDTTGFLGVSPYSVRVMVPESDLGKAREYLDEMLQGSEDPES